MVESIQGTFPRVDGVNKRMILSLLYYTSYSSGVVDLLDEKTVISTYYGGCSDSARCPLAS